MHATSTCWMCVSLRWVATKKEGGCGKKTRIIHGASTTGKGMASMLLRCIRGHRSPPLRSLLTRHAVKHFSSAERTRQDRSENDPRPPWVYSTSAGLRLVLIPSAYSYWEIRRICSSIRKVFYFMLCFWRISVTGSTSSCRYAVATPLPRKSKSDCPA